VCFSFYDFSFNKLHLAIEETETERLGKSPQVIQHCVKVGLCTTRLLLQGDRQEQAESDPKEAQAYLGQGQ
jgi:hypothetical protein